MGQKLWLFFVNGLILVCLIFFIQTLGKSFE